MFRLIFIELRKIFHKKGIYVIFWLMVIFCLLNNILYWTDYDEDGNYKYLLQDDLKREELELQKELKKYSESNKDEVSMYITIKTKLDLIQLQKGFKDTSWQYNKVSTYLYDIVYQLNYYQYIEDNQEELKKANSKYLTILNYLNNNDWCYFLNIEKEKLEILQGDLKKQLKMIHDKKELNELQEQLSDIEFQLKILKYRIDNQIKEDNSYLNKALETYQENYKVVSYYKDKNRNRSQEIEYYNALSEMKVSYYILENKENINKQNNLSYQLRTIVEDYEIFIVILILMISGTILADEFRDGTIKLLLIKPYSRGKILLSKYFAAIIVLGISIILLIMIQLLIGGIIFGFDSLDIPVVVYHYKDMKLIEYSIIQYMGIRILARLPFLIMMITISICLSVITNSSMISIMIPLILYMFGPSLLTLTIQYELEFMKYLVNLNWDLQSYLFGRISEVSFLNLKFSFIILGSCFIFLWILTFGWFKRKNIKNI